MICRFCFLVIFTANFKVMVIHDISSDLLRARLYPGTVPPLLTAVSDIGKGSQYKVSSLCADLHTGTHIDAPRHCIPDGKCIGELPLDRFLGKCIVVERNGHGTPLPAPDNGTGIVLFKNCREFPLTETECRDIVAAGFVTVGCDDITIGAGEWEYAVHRTLLAAGIPVIEGLCLKGIAGGVYFLSALPVKIGTAEASFCRAVLVEL